MKNKRLLPLNSLQAFEAAGRHESFLDAATTDGVERNVSPNSRHLMRLARCCGSVESESVSRQEWQIVQPQLDLVDSLP